LRASLTDQAYERLREAIINLELQPGAMYSEVYLADSVALGRTPAREAIQRLAREELVESKKNRGILITPIDVIKQLQLLDVRRSLEQLLARRACEQATTEERHSMLQFAGRIEMAGANGDIREFLAANRDIQDLKARAAHNETLRNTMDLFFGLSRRFWVAYHSNFPDSDRKAGLLHARILRAIAVSDVEAAVATSDELIDFLEEFTRQTVSLGPLYASATDGRLSQPA
jgi:DNA-binding GntR family transcriptional regulator